MPCAADEEEKAFLRRIEHLRERIEQTYGLGQKSLTSDEILRLSRRLDRLINAYLAKQLAAAGGCAVVRGGRTRGPRRTEPRPAGPGGEGRQIAGQQSVYLERFAGRGRAQRLG